MREITHVYSRFYVLLIDMAYNMRLLLCTNLSAVNIKYWPLE